MIKKVLCLVIVLMSINAANVAFALSSGPIILEDAYALGPLKTKIDFGYLQQQYNFGSNYPFRAIKSTISVCEFSIYTMLSKKLQIGYEFPYINRSDDIEIYPDSKYSTSTGSIGDIIFNTIFHAVKETKDFSEIALTLAVKFPTAEEKKGLGTDGTDIIPGIILSGDIDGTGKGILHFNYFYYIYGEDNSSNFHALGLALEFPMKEKNIVIEMLKITGHSGYTIVSVGGKIDLSESVNIYGSFGKSFANPANHGRNYGPDVQFITGIEIGL